MVNRTPNPCAGKGDVGCPMTVLYSTCFHHFSLLPFTSIYFLSVLLDLSLIFTPKLRFFSRGNHVKVSICRSDFPIGLPRRFAPFRPLLSSSPLEFQSSTHSLRSLGEAFSERALCLTALIT
jgi:hypothetical protein